jgi:ABC-2 type transport system permease protein
MIRRIFAIFYTRSLEFLRDKATLGWAVIFPVFMLAGFKLAYSDPKPALTIMSQEGPLFESKGIEWLKYDPVNDLTRLREFDVDAVYKNQTVFVNSENPKGDVVFDLIQAKWLTKGPILKEIVKAQRFSYADWLFPGIIGLNLMFGSLFGLGYVIVRYRHSGVLKRFQASPVSAFEFLFGQILSRAVLGLLVSGLIYFLGVYVFGLQSHTNIFSVFLIALVGSFCLMSLSLLVAARVRSEEIAGGLLNLLSWPMMISSGVWFSVERFEGPLRTAVDFIPLTPIVAALRGMTLKGHSVWQYSHEMIYLIVLGVVALLVASLSFIWGEEKD